MHRHSPLTQVRGMGALSRPAPTPDLFIVILEETHRTALEKRSLLKSQPAMDFSLCGGQAPRDEIAILVSLYL